MAADGGRDVGIRSRRSREAVKLRRGELRWPRSFHRRPASSHPARPVGGCSRGRGALLWPSFPPRKLDEKRYDHFGAGIVDGPATDLAEALKSPDQFTGKTVRLTGPITAVCQTKGCWMHLGSQTPPVMVKFKDYAFFVPKDASGYLEDAGKHEEAKKVTEGRKLYHFMATGVAIEKAAPKAD